MKKRKLLCIFTAALFSLIVPCLSFVANTDEETDRMRWQNVVTFPDWKGYTDDTLAMNSMYSFYGYHGQGTLQIQADQNVDSFRMYLNGIPMDTSDLLDGEKHVIDISAWTKNGRNTLQVSNISPSDLEQAIKVSVPYPEILPGTPEEEGFQASVFEFLSDLIESDIENGFTSAQLAVIRHGRLVYENAWGKVNRYLPDGSENTESPDVTTETLYDLASVTKMMSVNYALQKLVTEEKVGLDDKITQYLGEEFAADTILPGEAEADTQSGNQGNGAEPEVQSETSDNEAEPEVQSETSDNETVPDTPADSPDEIETETEDPELARIKEWKASLTIRDLLRHQGGFPPSPRYPAPYDFVQDLPEGEEYPVNPYFAGNGADEATKQATIKAICKTPLDYEPGTKTVYSDVDYMVLGLVVEVVSGQNLNTYLKENFWDPMGLTHITYNPLEHGFAPEDCAATELNGNTRDHIIDYPGYRTKTIQGEVHDEMAYYSMGGISGHAGLFANASDLARLGSVMLCGGYGEHKFFSVNVMNQFMAPKKEDAGNWGLGWWRQGDDQRVWYFGTQAASNTIGHQGWTGTLIMIDPERQMVIAYLTNKINTPVTNPAVDANGFDGNWYTASTLGFVPQILSMGLDEDIDLTQQLADLAEDMLTESRKLLPEGITEDSDHPAARNVQSKRQLVEKITGVTS